ncbi:MAG: PKD domain-containing protein [Saprospiraceae bacterium]|nr:PKD domain-containing protein [Saprospiraceae bacterium]
MSSRNIKMIFFKFSPVLFLLFAVYNSNAQKVQKFAELDQKFSDYQVLYFDSETIYNDIKSGKNLDHFIIKLDGGGEWNLNLRRSDIISKDYKLVSMEEDGPKVRYGTTAIPTVGTINGVRGSEVALTFNNNFIYGFLKIGMDEYYIEPVYHFTGQKPDNAFVLYSPRDIKSQKIYKCAYETVNEELGRIKNGTKDITGSRMPGQCIQIKYSNASDWSMRVKYGSVTGVENHNIGVMNDVQTNYDDEFADEIQFSMTEQWISSCSTCDPWTASTNAGTLLNSFKNWGPTGFSLPHDLAGLWTNRDLDGDTVGIAYLGVLCTNLRYHVLQDFTSNASWLRVLTAHEIGHNFNADHDNQGSNTIMAPAVSSATDWSSASIMDIQFEYNGATCLDNCSGGIPNPIANFTYNINSSCLPGSVQYFDQSTNAVTRLWVFPGGTPATSTAMNPVVQYNTLGVFGATLTVINASGNNSLTVSNIVTIIDFPFVDFVSNISGSNVDFTYTGSVAESFFWEFGDGGESTAQHPSYTYQEDGTYIVTLSTTNECGTNSASHTITIATAPTADFFANVNSGCQPFTVNFVNNSSNNAVSYLWTLPGGTPSTSTLINPTVVYQNPGTYNVTLKVTNNIGTDTELKNNYISVSPVPVASFNYTASGPTVNFTNSSQFANNYIWNFGDGTTSTAINPVHTFTSNGTFNVTLNAGNSCGSVTYLQAITVAVAPVASFIPNSNISVCAGQTINFQSTSSYNPTGYSWVFEGGSPSTSNQANPTVSFVSSGDFDVSLTVSNSFGSDDVIAQDMIIVNVPPQVSFTYLADGLTISYNDQIVNGNNRLWDFGDGEISNEPNPDHTYSAEGTYLVTLRAENECDTVIYSQSVLVQLTPTAGFTSSTTNICAPSTISYYNQSSPSVNSWLWSFDGGNPSTSTEPNPVVSYENPGTYTVSLTVANTVGQDDIVLNNYITVNTLPETGFQVNIDSVIVALINTGTSATSTNWNVSGNGFNIQLAGEITTFAAPSNGDYEIVQTNSNQCGEISSDTQIVHINIYPEALFTINGSLVCEGITTDFINQSSNGDSFEWSFEGGTPEISTEKNPSVYYTASGTYLVRLIATSLLGSDTTESLIIVENQPISGFEYNIQNNVVEFEFTGSNTNSINWLFGDNTSSTEFNPTHTYSTSGEYIVNQISENLCGKDTTTVTVNIVISSIDQDNLSKNILISPNPNNGIFKVLINNQGSNTCKMTLMDLFGRVVEDLNLTAKNGEFVYQFDASAIPASTYFLKISNASGVATKQIVIQK